MKTKSCNTDELRTAKQGEYSPCLLLKIILIKFKKMLKTNTNKFKLNFKNEILADINEDVDHLSDSDKLHYLAETIERQINYPNNLKRYPNTQERLADYLSGLAFNFCEAYPDQIIKQAERLVEGKFPEKKKSQIIENYFLFMAGHLMRLIEKEININFHKY